MQSVPALSLEAVTFVCLDSVPNPRPTAVLLTAPGHRISLGYVQLLQENCPEQVKE